MPPATALFDPKRSVANVRGAACPGPCIAAGAFRTSLDQASVLTSDERHLIEELLDRIENSDQALAMPSSAAKIARQRLHRDVHLGRRIVKTCRELAVLL
jgi:hypothetical protein